MRFGQLRLLVSDELARYSETVKANHLPVIRIQGESLRKGYAAPEVNANKPV